MTQDLWKTVDDYLESRFIDADPALDGALEASTRAGLPAIAVSATQGAFLRLQAKMAGARNILEIGTLGGYSTIWLARALPAGGKLITLEYEPRHAEVARENLRRAGVADLVDVRLGDAIDTLPALTTEAPFDFTFIDADKQRAAEYFSWALRLSRPGAAILVDNVVRDGEVADPLSTDELVLGIRRMHDLIAAEPRVSATALQTVGVKGYDGFTLAIVE